tara:strand:+ start:354 stop:578 length:225 start_codon:yes stop_codon:yes gene_type:complete
MSSITKKEIIKEINNITYKLNSLEYKLRLIPNNSKKDNSSNEIKKIQVAGISSYTIKPTLSDLNWRQTLRCNYY